ncbi:acyltransferase family protein [Sphingomonas jatrophae]|uniref:Peptidoglycan/LPS O-acetylase OafA/YrhL, contains acyltransferase and SGNH-hydrolase domains n=1 Tax=Sphingomonas jatrophae TaxID=1166337 RepID=A0A1I6M5N7_9SPHN|nr:acyltransferase [Sphingomonas jatrophae]SFS11006.1 Peptidoglycan/LPS O-acetylase OafA/YrhL, contains acyltransferase and SGNH-hydrolase domains [Sphingomonas jatrophae]
MAGGEEDRTGGLGQDGRPDTFRSVQYLRAVAAAMVMLYHVGYAFALLRDHPLRPHWLAAGVDIFFVISGFVMVLSTERREISGGRFLKERLARVVPLYWLVTGVFVAIMAAQGRVLPDVEEIAKSLLFIFYDNPRTHEPSPIVTAGWTLNYELFFYLVFALLIRLATPLRIGAMAALFLGLAALRQFVPHDDALLFRMTSPQPLEFVAGMALAYQRHLLLRLPPALGTAALGAGFVGLALIDSGFSRVVHFAPCATLIVAGTIACERLLRTDRPLARLLGDSSYSLYLTHPLVLEALPAGMVPPTWRLAGAAATLLACLGVSLAFYRWFELPSLRFFRRRLKGHPALAPAATARI